MVRLGEDDGLGVFFLWLCLFECTTTAASSVDCWCSDKNNYSLCAATRLPFILEIIHTHTHTVSKSNILLEKWSSNRQPQLCVCVSVSVIVPIHSTVYMWHMSCFHACDGEICAPTYLRLENSSSHAGRPEWFPPMWTAEYLMGSSVFSKGSSSNSSRKQFCLNTTYIGQNPSRHLIGAVRETAIVEVFYSSIKSQREFPAFLKNNSRSSRILFVLKWELSLANLQPLSASTTPWQRHAS